VTASSFFELEANSGGARAAWLHTPHGRIPTPVFQPVGTQGTVKGLLPAQLEAAGVTLLLGNAYHLHLRPGEDLVARLGGLHRFMGWPRPLLTDSGGFQVFSLAELRRVTDDGVEFQSHIDGSPVRLSPEGVTRIQNTLGADIIMAFDECVPYPCERDRAEQAVRRTVAWARRCQRAHERPHDQALFGIVQGSVFDDLRSSCARQLVEMDFPGYSIGGLSVGEGDDLMYQTLDLTLPLLPPDKPRYLMGVGTPENLLECIERGVDMFDCVVPTRNARSAMAFTAGGRVRLRNRRHRDDPRSLDAACDCYTCRTFSRGTLRHFFMAREMAAATLVTLHNLTFYQRLVRECREAILQGRFASFKRAFLERAQTEEDTAIR